MAKKKKTATHKLYFSLIIAFIAILIIGGIFFYKTPSATAPHTISPETSLLIDAAVWYPSAPWTTPKKTTQTTPLGTLSGEIITATVTSSTSFLPHFEMVQQLNKNGFMLSNELAADGAGSSMWGYTKEENGKSQILLFSYKTDPSSSLPNQPLQFNCPCKIHISVFASQPFGVQ